MSAWAKPGVVVCYGQHGPCRVVNVHESRGGITYDLEGIERPDICFPRIRAWECHVLPQQPTPVEAAAPAAEKEEPTMMIRRDLRWWAGLIADKAREPSFDLDELVNMLETFITDSRHGSSSAQINDASQATIGVSNARASIFRLIELERGRQDRLFPGKSIASSQLLELSKMRILVEEVGEVAEALDPEHANTKRNLEDELVQVAACAVGWLEGVLQPDAIAQTVQCQDCGCRADAWFSIAGERTRCFTCMGKAYLKLTEAIDGIRGELTEKPVLDDHPADIIDEED